MKAAAIVIAILAVLVLMFAWDMSHYPPDCEGQDCDPSAGLNYR